MQEDFPPLVVLGHTSFIGGALHKSIAGEGLSVFGASSKECNLLDKSSIAGFFRRIPQESVVAFCSVINRKRCTAISSLIDNLSMVGNLIDVIAQREIAGLVYLSSVDVYGTSPALPITEQTAVAPRGYYAMAKYCAERLLQEATLKYPFTILRLPGVYGAGDEGHSIVAGFVKKLLNGEPLRLTCQGRTRRDYIDVRDVVRLVRTCAEKPQPGLFNVATGHSLSLKDIAGVLRSQLQSKSEIVLTDEKSEGAGDLEFDVSKLCSTFAGEMISLEDGLAQYCAAASSCRL
jgi:nucleoside-diphosphate-sugar epimerase